MRGLLLFLRQIKGAFGVCFIFKDQPDVLIGARRGSPLLLGVGDGERVPSYSWLALRLQPPLPSKHTGEYFLASDASAVVEHTKDVRAAMLDLCRCSVTIPRPFPPPRLGGVPEGQRDGRHLPRGVHHH